MKKIVGILAAAAMAASVFAADVSAKVNILGDLGNWTKDSGVKVLGIAEGGQGWNPSFDMSVNGDNYGASMKFFDSGAKEGVSNVNYSIWIKPADILKITVGNWTTVLNQETIDWSNGATGIDADGFALSLAKGAFSADVFFNTGWSGNNFGWSREWNTKPWLSKAPWDEKVNIGETYLKVAYGADFGTISAYADYISSGSDFGVGYKGTFGSVSAFENVIAGLNGDWSFGIVRSETFVTTNINSIGLSAFIVAGYAADAYPNIAQDKLANASGSGAFVGATAKVTFPAGPFGGYVYLKDNAILGDFSLEVKPGITTNVGSCSIDCALDLYCQKAFKVDVPVTFTVAW